MQGTLSVDTFFFISGFLASYMLLIKLDKVSLGSPPPSCIHGCPRSGALKQTYARMLQYCHPVTDPVPMTSLATCLRRRPRA